MKKLIYLEDALNIAMQYCPDDDGSCSKSGVDIREMLDELESLPSVQLEPCEDAVSRNAAIDVLLKLQRALQLLEKPGPDLAILVIQYALREIKQLPSAEPEPEIHWGYTPTYERPLADREIVPRLRDIQEQVGGSYAIDRAIEIIEAVAERITE